MEPRRWAGPNDINIGRTVIRAASGRGYFELVTPLQDLSQSIVIKSLVLMLA